MKNLKTDIEYALKFTNEIDFDPSFLKDILKKIDKGLSQRQIDSAKKSIAAIHRMYDFKLNGRKSWAKDARNDSKSSSWDRFNDDDFDYTWFPNYN